MDVDLAAGRAVGQGTDALVAIENVIGTNFDDTMSGDGANNQLFAGAGDDRLQGVPGDDLLDGASGVDTASFVDSPLPITADLVTHVATGFGNDRLYRMENLTGSNENDVLAGDAAPNQLAGRDGRDVLRGEAGNDRLDGGNGDDTITGGTGIDYCDGGPDVDTSTSCETTADIP